MPRPEFQGQLHHHDFRFSYDLDPLKKVVPFRELDTEGSQLLEHQRSSLAHEASGLLLLLLLLLPPRTPDPRWQAKWSGMLQN